MPSQRVGPIAGVPALLAEFGVPLDALLAGTQIAPQNLTPDARLPMPAMTDLLERAVALTGCSHFGFLLGLRHDARALGLIGEMMASAPTLGAALNDYVGLQIRYSRAATVYLQRLGDDYAVGYGLYDGAGVGGRQIYDLVIAIGCNIIRALTGGRARPLRVMQSCRAPQDAAFYSRMLKAPVLFDQEQTCIVISSIDMALALPGADPEARQRLRDLAQQMAGGELRNLAARIRHALRPRLMIAEADRESVARDLGIGVRTLARGLAASGTSFAAIKDEVRYTVARELLALTSLPVGTIAELLSYSTHSAFNHAFQRWAGLSPSQWRAAQAGPPSQEENAPES